MPQAILFDFNGVIIDDERLQLAAYQAVLRPQGIELSEEQYFSALGMDDRNFVRTALERENKFTPELSALVIAGKVEAHRRLIAVDLPLFPGVVTFLKSAARSFQLGVVSMADANEVSYVLKRAHMTLLFSVVVTADDVNNCKPAPDCYITALEKLNQSRQSKRLLPLLPQECLAIEDSPPGIQSAREAGMRTLGVTNTVSEKQLRDAGAEVVTPNLADWNVDAVKRVFG